MATVYKRTRRRPIPKGAEIVTRSGKKYATWTDKRTKRQRRAPLADDAKAILLEAAHYTIEYFDHDGQRRRVGSKTPDKDASQRLANQLETGTMERARGLIDPRREQLAGERRRALNEHLADYEAKLRADNCDAKHVASTIGYIKVIAKEAGFTTAKDIQADRVNTYASKLRKGRSARTVQAHLTAIKQFTRWLAVHNKLPSDPLVSVTRPSLKGQRKRERRMLLPDEWEWLRSTTLKEGVIRNDVAPGNGPCSTVPRFRLVCGRMNCGALPKAGCSFIPIHPTLFARPVPQRTRRNAASTSTRTWPWNCRLTLPRYNPPPQYSPCHRGATCR